MIWFTSDLHLGHKNITGPKVSSWKKGYRNFDSVEQMDKTLIDNFNSKVKPGDDVMFLGDFCFRGTDKYINQLNGNFYFIRGNHDHDADLYFRNQVEGNGKKYPRWIRDVYTFKHDGKEIWLSHYAHKVWPNCHRGAYHLYGHSHGSLADDPNSLSFDCGVDCHNFFPLSLDDVVAIMEKKTFVPIDHHV